MGGARVNARWHREFLAHDPREDLRRLTVPVLALTGAKDLQVDAADLRTIAATVPGGATTGVRPRPHAHPAHAGRPAHDGGLPEGAAPPGGPGRPGGRGDMVPGGHRARLATARTLPSRYRDADGGVPMSAPSVAAVGALTAAGTLAGLLLATTVGLFGFTETTSADLWWESFWVELPPSSSSWRSPSSPASTAGLTGAEGRGPALPPRPDLSGRRAGAPSRAGRAARTAGPRSPSASGSNVSARRSSRDSPSPSVGTASSATRAASSASATSGSARNACALSRRIR